MRCSTCCIHKVIGCGEVKDDSVKFSRGGSHEKERDKGGYAEFDCTVEVENWQFAWAEEQKEACCKTVGVGCTEEKVVEYPKASEADNFFDCSKGRPSNWPPKKRKVCCASNVDCQRRLRGP
eukprot:g30669.t1